MAFSQDAFRLVFYGCCLGPVALTVDFTGEHLGARVRALCLTQRARSGVVITRPVVIGLDGLRAR